MRYTIVKKVPSMICFVMASKVMKEMSHQIHWHGWYCQYDEKKACITACLLGEKIA